MCEYNVGDIVVLKRVSDDDKLQGRYAGEIGVFQNLYNYGLSNEKDSAEIRFGDTKGYVVYLEDLELIATADIDSVFIAHGVENNKKLLKDVKTCVRRILLQAMQIKE